MAQRFVLHNFGCRASQADGAAIEAQLLHRGFEAASDAATAGLVVLNTCTVTATADDEVRQVIRRVHRQNPEARILVTGCYAQRAPDEIAELPGVAWVIGNPDKARIADFVTRGDESDTPYQSHAYHGQVAVSDVRTATDFGPASLFGLSADKTRPNLKIQDGCPNRCSFCIIPSVRGRSRSMPADQVVSQVRAFAERSREVVLTGINLGRWGREPGSAVRLAGLLRRLLEETAVERLRLSSIEPMDLTTELLELMAGSARIAAHVHAPLQSGSASVLRRMRRKYRPQHYAERIRLARELMPDAAVGADVMTGFPGETNDEFRETRDFIDGLPFTYLHVFTYSERPGTEAATMPDGVAPEIRKERTHSLREIGAAKNRAFRSRMVGRRLSAITLSGPRSALSSNYLTIGLASDQARNQMIEVEIGSLSSTGLVERGALPVIQ